MKHLVSSEVQSALRADPLFDKAALAARAVIKKLPTRFEDGLSRRIGGPVRVSKVPTTPSFSSRYIGQQLRGVIHSSERAVRTLGYVRIVEFPESMERFRRWYVATRGMQSESWPLARELLRPK
jgi:hypothetical protein